MSDTMKEYIAEAEKDLLHTYNRYQIVLDKGDGVYLYDIDGKKYLDFVAGIAVFALGYQNKAYNDALKAQIDKVIHTSNYYYNVPAIEAARKIKKVSGMDRVFFTNSGAEAVEGAIKAARKYAYLKDGCTDHEIIAMNHSFHGRTMGALSVTGNPKYREAFQPMIGHIKFADLNNFQSVLDQVTDKTCAIIMETVQGEGGLYPATEEFLKQVRDLCDERDILLILDEIGRGTSTFDGLSIAWAVVEHISNTRLLGAKTLFATHYHELTELEGLMSGVTNYCIAVKEQGDDIVFLRKIVKGGADKSYGIQVAKLAGVPDSVINRAKELVEQLVDSDLAARTREIAEGSAPAGHKPVPKPDDVEMSQLTLFDTVREDDIIEELKNLELGNMTPIDALNTLYRMQTKLKNRWSGEEK